MSLEQSTIRRAELQRIYDKRKDVLGWRQNAVAVKAEMDRLDAEIAKEAPPE